MSKFAIIDAVEKPKTQRSGLQLYPWQDLEVGKGFFVPDEKAKSKCAATSSAKPATNGPSARTCRRAFNRSAIPWTDRTACLSRGWRDGL